MNISRYGIEDYDTTEFQMYIEVTCKKFNSNKYETICDIDSFILDRLNIDYELTGTINDYIIYSDEIDERMERFKRIYEDLPFPDQYSLFVIGENDEDYFVTNFEEYEYDKVIPSSGYERIVLDRLKECYIALGYEYFDFKYILKEKVH